MARSDFNIEEDNNESYNNQIPNNKTNIFNRGFNSAPEIIYDDNTSNSFLGDLKFRLSTINKNVIMFFSIVAAIVIIAIIVIVALISGYSNSFKTNITIPDVVYLGETATISAISEGKGDTSKTVAKFSTEKIVEESDEEYNIDPNPALELLNEEQKGQEIYNTIIPIQEGGVKITVKAKSGTHNMGRVSKNVYVCPRFDSKLAPNGIISVKSGEEIENPIDFGPGTCSANIKYKSSNSDIFTVDNTGKIKGLKQGVSSIIISKGERTFSVPVQITGGYVGMKDITVNPQKMQIMPGENRRLQVSYLPSNTNTQTLSVSTDNSEVVKVNNFGKIIGIKPGKAKVSVSSSDATDPQVIEVVVSNLESNSGSLVTDLMVDKTSINLAQGESSKINAIITPDEAKIKKLNYTSSDSNVASINSQGVIYAKNSGTAVITAATDNSITRTIQVKVTGIETPIVLADDGIIANNWHNRDYKLKFKGGRYGANYYYGYDKDKLNNKGKEAKIEKDGVRLIYSKACIYNLCGPVTSTLSKLDSEKPKILKVINRKNTSGDNMIYIAAEDNTSMVNGWCVINSQSSNSCKWINISPIKNPVLSLKANSYEGYSVFVKDTAGNISDRKVITIQTSALD